MSVVVVPQRDHDMVCEGHLGGCGRGEIGDPRTYVPSVWSGLIERYNVSSVLDLGCGYGHSLKWFQDHGVIGYGIEGFREAIENTVARPDSVMRHDFTAGPIPILADGEFDLCWCSEFAEHVPAECEGNWLDVATRCRVIALTAARPGHAGHNHVNLKPEGYWINRFAGLGYDVDWTTTRWLRSVANEAHGYSYFGSHGLVFVRRAVS